MSLCALLTVFILAGSVGPGRFYDGTSDLDRVVEDFRDLVEKLMASGAACTAAWTVPALSDGEAMTMSVEGAVIRGASAAGGEVRASVTCSIHSWVWDGSPLSQSDIIQLDETSPPVSASSGEDIHVQTTFVMLENVATLCTFVQGPG